MRSKNILYIVLGTALILSVPLIAMQFTSEVKWGFSDFIIIGGLLLGAGLAYEFIASKVKNKTHRAVIAMVFVVAVLLIWAELAVGVFGSPFSGE